MNGAVLIAEDEPQIAQLLADYLARDGFTPQILTDGAQVVQTVRQKPPQMVLLDIMLPGKNGVQICREIRQFSTVPIIFITAKVEEIDRLIGLEIGGDDYICKPFSPREVVARVRTVLRRIHPEQQSQLIVAGPVAIDLRTRIVTVDGTEIDLTPREYGLLKALAANPGKVFTRAELLDHVQGHAYEGYERAIDSHIKNLRRKIEESSPSQTIIQTVYGVGYRFSEK